MAQEDNRSSNGSDFSGELPSDDVTQLKKRARRRLIGALALALLAAVVLPLVMDHQPAPALKDIQVRIPSPDEGVTQRVATPPVPKSVSKDIVVKMEPRPEVVPEVKPEPQAEVKPVEKPVVEPSAPVSPVKMANEVWEIQLGAYQEPARVKILVGKLKQLGLPAYTENVETANGARTRVRAGPFPSQESAEKARVRVKILGVDGPVAKKP